jgi:hypothetical protein
MAHTIVDYWQNLGKNYTKSAEELSRIQVDTLTQITRGQIALYHQIMETASKQANLYNDSKTVGDIFAHQIKLSAETTEKLLDSAKETVTLLTGTAGQICGCIEKGCEELQEVAQGVVGVATKVASRKAA